MYTHTFDAVRAEKEMCIVVVFWVTSATWYCSFFKFLPCNTAIENSVEFFWYCSGAATLCNIWLDEKGDIDGRHLNERGNEMSGRDIV